MLSVLGLPLDMIRARVKFLSGTDGARSSQGKIYPCRTNFFGTRTFFIRVNGALEAERPVSQNKIREDLENFIEEDNDRKHSHKWLNGGRIGLKEKREKKTGTVPRLLSL